MTTEATYTEQMEEYLKTQGFFEDEKESVKRERVLGILNSLLNKSITSLAQKARVPVEKNNMCKIFTFGSYRLGVHSKDADIDTLCVAPNFVSRNDFFTLFYNELAEKEYIEDISKVTNTFVPLIKFKIHKIPIDLVFARLDLPFIPPNIDLLDNKLLKHMDEKCIVSLNGNRVTDEILAVVPEVETFHKALRFVKYWAQKRRVYGHSFGYMGGVAYALCLAKVCQMHPDADAFSTVSLFFSVLCRWPWPQPIIIKEVPDYNYNLKIWNPRANPAQRSDKMPVITPVYPPICSTYNITVSTLTVMKREFARSSNIIQQLSNSEISPEAAFEALCAPSDFFTRHKNYFLVVLASSSQQELKKFSGFAIPKIRVFAAKLEIIENISYAYVYPEAHEGEGTMEQSLCLKKLGATDGTYAFCAVFVGIEFSSAKLPLNASRRMNLKKPVDEFKGALEAYEPEEECDIRYEVVPLKQKGVEEILKDFEQEKETLAPQEKAPDVNAPGSVPASGPVSAEKKKAAEAPAQKKENSGTKRRKRKTEDKKEEAKK